MKIRSALYAMLFGAFAFGLLCLAAGVAVNAQEQPSQQEEPLQQEQPAQVDQAVQPEMPETDATGGPFDLPQDMLDGEIPIEEPPAAPAVESSEAAPAVEPNPTFERPGGEISGLRGASGKISFNFNNASLDSVVNVIVRASGLKFIRTAPLTGAVTISNLDPVTVDEAIDIVDAILHTQGFAFVRDGDILTIAPIDAAKTQTTPVYQGTGTLTDEDLPKGAKIITWVQPLKSADATKVAKDLANLVSKNGSLTANQSSNTLIIADTASNVQRLLRVVRQLDAQGSQFDVRIFTLQYADANDVANVIRQIFVDQGSTTGVPGMAMAFQRMRMRGPGGPGGPGADDTTGGSARDTVKVAANPGTNSVVVAATPDNLELIGKMVEQIDTVAAGSPQTIGVFHLENADCQELTNVLKNVMGLQVTTATATSSMQYPSRRGQPSYPSTPSGTSTYNSNPPGRPSSMRPSGFGGSSGGRSSLGPSSQLEPGDILVWPPRRVAASGSGAEALGEARPVRPGVDMEVRRAAPVGVPADAGAGEPSAIQRMPLARNAQVIITYDQRTGTVIVSAPEETMALIRSVVEELDRDPAEKYISQVYHLNNATASNLASVMTAIFSGTTLPTGEGIAQELRGQVTVVPDASSNSLVITSAPRNFERIYQLVKDLDQAPPQVMIQAVLVEVSINGESNIGMRNIRFDPEKLVAQHQFGVGGDPLFWAVLNEKVDGFIDLLQTNGSVEVLSRPQILASDNKPAQINVGQSVPFVTRVQTTESGNTINTIQYQDIGIILTVTPHINPEGYVNMDIAPQISNFADSSVNVGNNVSAPVFTNRAAQSTVAIQDGQTIVIGGLMTNEDRKTVHEIPLLGKIPLIGPILFRHTTVTKVKTDLLVILTPKVVRTAEQAERLSAEERARSALSSGGKTEQQMRNAQICVESTSLSPNQPPVAPQGGPSGVKVVPFPKGPGENAGEGNVAPQPPAEMPPQPVPEGDDSEDEYYND